MRYQADIQSGGDDGEDIVDEETTIIRVLQGISLVIPIESYMCTMGINVDW